MMNPVSCPLSRFQFTRPRGARRSLSVLAIFQPSVSIHAPARGATRRREIDLTQGPRFNSRAREGRDGRDGKVITRDDGFNSRAREGRDTFTNSLPFGI